jgi:tetratricopeptide (TPR) repeat protein
MAAEIKREEAGQIVKKLHDCHIHLQKGNIYSCLTGFRDALDLTLKTKMLPADQKQLQKDINDFQSELASSRAFRHLYGPVTFSDDDIPTALDFMKQLIMIKDEEILEAMEKQKEADSAGAAEDDLQKRIYGIMLLVEKGEFAAAQDLAEKDEEAREALIEMYNTTGIESRKTEDYEKAIKSFKNALFINPDDEGLHYNLARAYIGATDWKSAKISMEAAMKINPDFREGAALMAFIEKNMQHATT